MGGTLDAMGRSRGDSGRPDGEHGGVTSDDVASSRADIVHEALRLAIHEGRLRPGDRLRENEIAQQLGVSRTPVREALKRLEQRGLIAIVPQRGVIVNEFDQQRVVELYAWREVLEVAAVRFATQHATETELQALDDILEAQRALPEGSADGLTQVDRRFHRAIYGAARNGYLLQAFDLLRDTLALLGGSALVPTGHQSTALEQHVQIVEAIKRRDADAAETAAREHIRTGQRLRLFLLFQRA